MSMYIETVLRYRILRHTELPEEYKAEYRLRGLDPDDIWSLIYSFREEQPALDCLVECQKNAPKICTYKLVDAGADELIDRPIW